MNATETEILEILDRAAAKFFFPVLDNGYVYLAATRLSLFRSPEDWALVIEVFGYSPRAGVPDTHISTFASRIHDRDPPETYNSRAAYENYLANHPHDDSTLVFPLEHAAWQEVDDGELIAVDATAVSLRGDSFPLPSRSEYKLLGIELADPARVWVYEFCRYVAAVARDRVLATPTELRALVRPEMSLILQLDEWHHPDITGGEKPSDTEAVRQLAKVLTTGDVSQYRPTEKPNTDWRNWPEGGTL